MIVIIGDSNYREICTSLKGKFETDLGEKIIFRQATTNESLKLVLEEEEESGEKPKVIVVGANLNEIATRVTKNQKKGRDETVKTVVMEQNSAINKWALEHRDTMVLVVPPFLRKEPPWMEERLKWVHFCMKDDINIYSPGTVVLGTSPNILDEDLKLDKVHLMDSGMEKVAVTMIDDLKIFLKDVENLRSEMMDSDNICFESSQLADRPSKTPKTAKKDQEMMSLNQFNRRKGTGARVMARTP